MNIIEKLEALIKFHSWDHEHANGDIENLVSVDDLRAIIEEYKNAKEPVAVYEQDTSHLKELDDWDMAKGWRWNRKDFKRGDKIFTHPPLSDETVKVPEGYAFVPIEPTDSMIRSALDCQDHDPEDGPDSEVYYMYKAMIDEAMKADK